MKNTALQIGQEIRKSKYILNIILTGKCNINCDFCAYTRYKCFDKMPEETFRKTLYELKTYFSMQGNKDILLVYTGGEPTKELEQLELFTNIVKEEFPNELENGKITQVLVSNGLWGSDESIIEKIKSLDFGLIQLSCSKDHLNEVPKESIENIINTFDGLDTQIWCSFIGGVENNEYKTTYELCKDSNVLLYDIRNIYLSLTECLSDSYSDKTITFYPMGLSIRPDGILGPCCSGEGINTECFLGNIEDLTDKLFELPTSGCNIALNNSNIDVSKVFPICRHIKQSGIPCSCFNNTDISVTYKDGKFINN